MIAFICGFGLCALVMFGLEAWSRRTRRHRQRGNYFDARQPFAIEGRGPTWAPERSEELIAREARRLVRGHPFPLARLPKSYRPPDRDESQR